MDLAALVFATGWASGVNAWATVAVLGIVARAGGSEWVPTGFGDWWVIGLGLAMFTVEFVVDKVPWLDSAWDGVSTVVRPVVGAVVAWKLAESGGTIDPALLAALGGGTALASHGVKSGVRAAVNTSPEPFSNVALSTGEDVGVIAVVLLALTNPWVAFTITAVALVLGLALVVWLWRTVRRLRRRHERRA
ncbi:hypothetical protein AFL01nite_00960 [Aeromicrobium flavum]|uniref:DUF4126 domain-containing protein n=1 Tax=Aeromicrobium flavum TaxID=416568 RepID=A0A512HQP6_9ACTN|nr:DUF4126 domain-containing protein [Aeromicrobium flavum]GEO87769.1 hypothetical protein AFL01nite_00960 [Aeromicrobium flavum]